MIDDVGEKRGSDHRREEQSQRPVNRETPSCSETSAQNDVGNSRDGITMLEAVQHTVGEQPGEACEREDTQARTSKTDLGLIAESRTRHVGDGGARHNVKNDNHGR